MDGKAFVGMWVSRETRKRFKLACVLHGVSQGDVMEILLEKWLDRPHVKDEFKKILNGTKEK